MSIKTFLIGLLVVAYGVMGWSQDPTRFAEQIEIYLAEEATSSSQRPIIFVGSSSIRMWQTLSEDYPQHPILNRGFGGSVMSDLWYYRKELIVDLSPKQVFIYEGDNDLSMGKPIQAILDTTKLLVWDLKEKIPDIKIVLISPKPSLSRFNLRTNYQSLNQKLKEFTIEHDFLDFADVWEPMLGENKLVRSDLFIQDGLHMNVLGYEIWKRVLQPFLISP